ncbi:MAG: hypothetical protein GY859_18160 [Desulfobacterales bacterium]|nr:hypothetical protein [Desulfobacterales bacterium]
MEHLNTGELHQALGRLRRTIPRLADALRFGDDPDVRAWKGVVDRKLLPWLSPEFPLIATICGGGSSGKSTLFNTLVGSRISPVGGTAGINRRALISIHGDHAGREDFLTALYAPFGRAPEKLVDMEDLTRPGDPLYAALDTIPKNLILLDTPDFDTGARGVYANREIAGQALEASDVLIYIFTNSNYNNRDNTDFIARMLTGIGRRKCFLVYRVYPSFREEEVLEHAMTVARNIYGDEAGENVLGIYRADDDNAVAAGEAPMRIEPVRSGEPPMMRALQRIDYRALRMELLTSILVDILDKADGILSRIRVSRDRLSVYLDALQASQSRCVYDALRHFPMDRVMQRFGEIWLASDPPHIRFMRKTGKVIDFPVKTLFGAVRWLTREPEKTTPRSGTEAFAEMLEADLIDAASGLHRQAASKEISVSLAASDPIAVRMAEVVEKQGEAGEEDADARAPRAAPDADKRLTTFNIPAHPIVLEAQKGMRGRQWGVVLESILSQKESIISLSEGIEAELSTLADALREQMGLWDRTRQVFSAFMNVLPATAAVTYILVTADPLGGTGIQVKLSGLFGLNDLYALVALPATTGLKSADKKQLERMLGPVAKTWLDNKLTIVQALFEREITGAILESAAEALERVDEGVRLIEENMGRLRGIPGIF